VPDTLAAILTRVWGNFFTMRRLFAIGVMVLLSGSLAWADQLDEIKKRGELIWGADEEGGAPYVFRDPKQDNKLVGFEVELADMLAQELGVKAKFQQGEWVNLPQLLDQRIDIVLNGYELSGKLLKSHACSRPYYMYGLQLVVRRDSPIQNWESLTAKDRPRNYSVCVLKGSAAETYLNEHYDGVVRVESSDTAMLAMSGVTTGTFDATLQDDCMVVHVADEFPELRFVERPVGAGYYVAVMRKGETRLHAAIDEALGKIIADGRLKSLYDRWNMAGRAQVLALRNVAEIKPAPDKSLWETLHQCLGELGLGALMTIFLSFVSMPIAIFLGMLIAVGRLYGPRWLKLPLAIYVEVLRGTPLMLQLLFIFYFLPNMGLVIEAIPAAIIGLSINYSAYESEIYRAGLQAVPGGQMEAALSLGMTKPQAILKVILPQAIRIVIPPVTNDFIALFKDTSICSIITVVELTKQYSILARNDPTTLVHLTIITGVLYLMMSYPLSVVARWNEARLARGKVH